MGPFMAVIPLVISAAGAVASGVAASHQAEYQANVAKQNAEFNKQKADMIAQDSATKSAEMGLQQKASMGQMQAAQASHGLQLGTGSTQDVESGARKVAAAEQRDYAKAWAQGDWYSARKGQWANQAEAELQKSKGEFAMLTGAVEGGSSLMSGASKMNKEYGWFA